MITTWLLSSIFKVAKGPLSAAHSLASCMVEKEKIRLYGNDVTLLPDEVVKSFLET